MDDPDAGFYFKKIKKVSEMTRMRRYLLSALLVLLVASPLSAFELLSVCVSILPQKYFVERIGGDRVEVEVMVPRGASPAVYEPRPRQMVALSGAKIYFAVGVPFEHSHLEGFADANSTMRIVHTEEEVRLRPMVARSGHRSPEVMDPHVWLSPPDVLIQCRSIMRALITADPEHASEYSANYRRFAAEIIDLDLEIGRILGSTGGGGHFMVFHPSWGYFARAYGLEQFSIESEGKEPKQRELAELIDRARGKRFSVIFIQPGFSSRAAETIASAIGGRVEVLDPLAYDWPKNLLRTARLIRSSMR